jgi:hypothetical protein
MAKLTSGTRIYGNATIDTNLIVSGNTISNSNTTGTITVTGGVGVTGNVYAANYFYANGIPVGAASGGGNASAAGSTTQIQYNNAGVFSANSNFTYTINDVNIPFGTSNTATSIAKIALALSMIA